MKKPYLIIIGLLFNANIFAQINSDLIQNIWIKTKSERKDGSRIIDHLGTENFFGIYIYNRDSIRNLTNPSSESIGRYEIIHNQLEINKNISYQIEKLTKDELTLCENIQNKADDEVNRYYFKSLVPCLDSLINFQLIEVSGDTIIANNRYFPYLKQGNLNSFLWDELGKSNKDFEVIGSFIISPNNEIIDIKYKNIDGFKKNFSESFSSALISSSGKWVLPDLQRKYYIKIIFDIQMGYAQVGQFKGFVNHFYFDNIYEPKKSWTGEQSELANEFYIQGIENVNNSKYTEALELFTKCIEIDSLYLNAFYNRAYIYYTLNNLDKACKDWDHLSGLNQNTAKEYYKQNCKK